MEFGFQHGLGVDMAIFRAVWGVVLAILIAWSANELAKPQFGRVGRIFFIPDNPNVLGEPAADPGQDKAVSATASPEDEAEPSSAPDGVDTEGPQDDTPEQAPAPCPPSVGSSVEPTPEPTMSTPTTLPAEVQRFSASHKKFGGDRRGELVLSDAELRFVCFEDPAWSFSIDRRDIAKVHKDGVQILTGKKYHFTVDGKNKSAVHELIAQWMDH